MIFEGEAAGDLVVALPTGCVSVCPDGEAGAVRGLQDGAGGGAVAVQPGCVRAGGEPRVPGRSDLVPAAGGDSVRHVQQVGGKIYVTASKRLTPPFSPRWLC